MINNREETLEVNVIHKRYQLLLQLQKSYTFKKRSDFKQKNVRNRCLLRMNIDQSIKFQTLVILSTINITKPTNL